MPRGGRREGSGRKKGSSPKDKLNERTIMRLSAMDKPTPLEVMLNNMWAALDRNDEECAQKYAVDAAKYVHKVGVELSGDKENPIHVATSIDRPTKESREEWLARQRGDSAGPCGHHSQALN